MNNKISHDYVDHAAEAIARLKASRMVQEAEEKGLIPPDAAADAVLKLNQQALDESERALRIVDRERHRKGGEEQLESPVA